MEAKKVSSAVECEKKVSPTYIIPSLATEALDDDIHDVDGKVEVGLLLDERAQAVEGGGAENRILCERQRKVSSRAADSEECNTPLTSVSHISRKRL